MSDYAPNPVYGARQYEILVAQRADPRIEVQSRDDACFVLRFSVVSAQRDVTFLSSSPAPIEETLIRAARYAMADDIRDPRYRLMPQASEVTADEYWREIAHLAATQVPHRSGRHRVWDRQSSSDWHDYLYRTPRTPHPMVHGLQRALDVLRHTAHVEEYARESSSIPPVLHLFQFVSEAAAWAMAGDLAEQASGSILYRPNPRDEVVSLVHGIGPDGDCVAGIPFERLEDAQQAAQNLREQGFRIGINVGRMRNNPARDCLTSESKLPYPCQLRRLQHFDDISFTMGSDAVGFTIGNRDYVLQIGDDDEKYFRLTSVVANEPLPYIFPVGSFELETDSEAELLAYLGGRLQAASRLRRPNRRHR